MMLPEEGARQRTRRMRTFSILSILAILILWIIVTMEWGGADPIVRALKLPGPGPGNSGTGA